MKSSLIKETHRDEKQNMDDEDLYQKWFDEIDTFIKTHPDYSSYLTKGKNIKHALISCKNKHSKQINSYQIYDESKSRIENLVDQLYFKLKQPNRQIVEKKDLYKNFYNCGILHDDPRIEKIINLCEDMPDEMDRSMLQEIMQNTEHLHIIQKTLSEDFKIQQWDEFKDQVHQIYQQCKQNSSGKVADYIPELAKKDPQDFGVSICTVEGQRVNFGDYKTLFSVQSCSKSITYALALENLGQDEVHNHVGHEPSGVAFNAICLNKDGLPHNPLINSGAIMTCSLIKPELDEASRFNYVIEMWQKLSGGKRITYDNSVYLSEKNSAHTNFALAHLMMSNGAFPKGVDIKKVLEFYFMNCSLEADSDSLAVIAATLANGGQNPLTDEQVLQPATVQNVLSLMNCCGMYDYSGEFSFRVGLPAKSGVSGAVMTIIPGFMGICTYSPPLDDYGNSARGVQFIDLLSQNFLLHQFRVQKNNQLQVRKENILFEFLQHCAEGDLDQVKRIVIKFNQPQERQNIIGRGDYDGRTALHLACSQGQIQIVKYLIESGLYDDINPKDRIGNTPIDDAIREKHHDVVQYLQDRMKKSNPLN